MDKETRPKIKITADGHVYYNGIDISDCCLNIKTDMDYCKTTVVLTYDCVSLEIERKQ